MAGMIDRFVVGEPNKIEIEVRLVSVIAVAEGTNGRFHEERQLRTRLYPGRACILFNLGIELQHSSLQFLDYFRVRIS